MQSEYQNEIIGRLFLYLLKQGITKTDLKTETVPSILGEKLCNDEKCLTTAKDAIEWMEAENLIRIDNSYPTYDGFSFHGVQLTHIGMDAAKAKPISEVLDDNIEKPTSVSDETNSECYSKFGAFLGSFVGSLIKS